MTQSLRPYSALALARALNHQHPQHHAAVRSFSSYSQITTWFQDWFKDSTTPGFKKQQHKILTARESDCSKGGRETQQPEKRPTRQNEQLQSEQKLRHLPYPGSAHGSSINSNSNRFIDRRKGPSGGSKDPPNTFHAAKKSDAVGLKTKALEKTPTQCMSPSVSKQSLQTDQVTKSTSTGSNKPGEIRAAIKNKDLQGIRTPEKSQDPAKLPRQARQQAYYAHKLQHLPQHGGASKWRNCSDKCELFCQWNDSLTGGLTKPKDEICVATKSNVLQGARTPEKSQDPAKPPSQATQQPLSEHKLQHAAHQGDVSSWRTCSDKCGLFCQCNDPLTGGLTKPKDETCAPTKNNDLQGDKTPEVMIEQDESPNQTSHQPHSENKFQHLPHQGVVSDWRTCSDKCGLFCQWNDSLSSVFTKPKDENRVATKNNDLQADKKPKDMLGPGKSPSQATQQPHPEHKLQHQPHQGGVSNWHTCSDKCGLFCQCNDPLTGGLTKPKDETRAPTKTNDLQGDKTPKDMLQPAKSHSETTQQQHSEHKFQHLPHHGTVNSWRTCSDKCGLFCQWSDSLRSGLDKPTNKIPDTMKSDEPEGGRTPENTPERAKTLSDVKQLTQTDHHLPHHEAVRNWPTRSDKSGLPCVMNGSSSGGSNKPSDEILVVKSSDNLERDRATEKTDESALTQTKQPSSTGDESNVMLHSKSRNPPKPSTSDSALQRRRIFDEWDPPPNEWRTKLYAMNMVEKSGEKASEKKQQPTSSSSQVTQAPKTQHANEPYNGELITQFPNYVHMLLRTRSETRNLGRRSNSLSTLRQRHSYGGWDRPPNKLRITAYAKKSGSTPGGKSPDKPGTKAPEKTQQPTKPPEKTEGPKRKFSRHVDMILDRMSFSKKAEDPAKEKDQKPKGEEGSKTSKSGKK